MPVASEKPTSSEYYRLMRALAQSKRREYGIATADIRISSIQKIYRLEKIKIDRREKLSARIRGAYFCDDGDCSVLLNNGLPPQPKLFTLVHELKHHFVDRGAIEGGKIQCGSYNANQTIEIGAEVFAAEFIYPESEMRALLGSLGVNSENCDEQVIVRIKRAVPVPVSFRFVLKRLVWFRITPRGKFDKTKFTKIEEQMYGTPLYKRGWFKDYRRRKTAYRRG